ncbi:hypothetical protein A3709_19740 [Halioglobus sp. HI00S01]|uniref:hypothetical protein n=1 Tax=Halioglobus sp. HI00S01 TaxID=1822214 RepID=UPI0007C33015|nr:hypothetical protein [Halioglobus sp. HI00S01]KZX57859.1 hypothetical protein A3709_19740 [Halioglobus sp. HI00S01]
MTINTITLLETIVDIRREVATDITTKQIMALFAVASYPGSTCSQISEKVESSYSATNKVLNSLLLLRSEGTPGLNLVEVFAENKIERTYFLSQKGRALVKRAITR